MKIMVAIIVGSLVLAAGTAAAQTTGFYIRGDIGIALAAPSTEIDTNPAANNASLGTDRIVGTPNTAAMFDMGVGYRFAPFMRFEGTVGYIPSMTYVGAFASTPTSSTRSSLSVLIGLANAYVDIAGLVGPLPFNIQPFVTGGVGVATVFNGPEDDYNGGVYANTFSGNTTTNVAWAAGGGFGIPLSDRVMLDVTYRYMDLGQRLTGPTLTVPPGTQLILTQDRADLQVHTVMIGLRYRL